MICVMGSGGQTGIAQLLLEGFPVSKAVTAIRTPGNQARGALKSFCRLAVLPGMQVARSFTTAADQSDQGIIYCYDFQDCVANTQLAHLQQVIYT